MSDWWEQGVVYEIYPRSFQDSDGDGIGDLPGVRSRLDYLQWLGVDAIWLAPIYASPLADFGYDVSDHTRIAPEYGTEADFDALVADAHRRGIRVLLDLVASHTSIEHPWFRQHPERYVWSERPAPNNWVASFGGPAWSLDERSGRYYLHSFFAEQPDLDWRNPDVREAMAGVIRHWLERGVDGFRVDAVDRLMKDRELRDDPRGDAPFPLPLHPDGQGLDPVHSRDDPEIGIALEALRDAAGDAALIGEVYLPGARLGPYLERLDQVFSFDLLHAPWDATALAAVLEGIGGARGIAWVLSNHDFSRVASRWGEEAMRAAALLLLTMPGSAFLYQGEEIGMVDGPGGGPRLDRFGRDSFRHPMQWQPGEGGGFTAGSTPWLPPVDPARRNVADQRRDAGSMLALFRRLIAARRSISGPLAEIEARDGLLRYRRGSHRIVINAGSEPRSVGALGEGRVEVATSAAVDAGDAVLGPGDGVLLRIDS